ncbi:MAG: tyrosine-protein phosphatase [Phycisphaerae bacterium]|jgi:protein tyrosine/serine phosphatase|nr:tyrosine-protein phosphatase [Phycisphaerae bacterium]MCZ2401041.1 tyrosine-protein phosphatase [Phycisphaerae bacterium]
MGNDVNRRRLVLILLAAASVGIGAGAWAWRSAAYPKRFAEVVPGRLYRSGELAPQQLERVAREHGVRTVLSLLDPNAPQSVAERAAAERLGLRWINVPLRGDGSSTDADRDVIRDVILDPDCGPLLVHCAAGANRTGLAIAMYRINAEGWTVEQALAEMRRFGFDDLPKHQNLRDALAAEAQRAGAGP